MICWAKWACREDLLSNLFVKLSLTGLDLQTKETARLKSVRTPPQTHIQEELWRKPLILIGYFINYGMTPA